MSGNVSKSERKCSKKYVMNLKEKMRVLHEEIKEMMYEREKEIRGYKRDIMVVEDKEEKIREMEVGMMEKNSEKEWELMDTKFLVEQMKEERARRDKVVEK
ncbi:hypothetical protein RJT34_06767 [Clitoria ternatea]|uniref:Uncharacterized protein n=1 Tax=Clitoria ternatea TaxID=43366 RepID=A0AAN9K3R8_CLITE